MSVNGKGIKGGVEGGREVKRRREEKGRREGGKRREGAREGGEGKKGRVKNSSLIMERSQKGGTFSKGGGVEKKGKGGRKNNRRTRRGESSRNSLLKVYIKSQKGGD